MRPGQKMAEGGGLEPPTDVNPQQFSRLFPNPAGCLPCCRLFPGDDKYYATRKLCLVFKQQNLAPSLFVRLGDCKSCTTSHRRKN